MAFFAAIGVVRPRWLTTESRWGWRRWLAWSAFQATVRIWGPWWVAWSERLQGVRAEMEAELGRPATDEELASRMEELEGQKLT